MATGRDLTNTRFEGAFDYADQTILHPLGLTAVILLGVLLLLLPRKYAILPVVAMACFVSARQRLAIFDLDFDLLRLMIIFGWVRVLVRQEYKSLRRKPLDICIVAWTVYNTFAYVLLHRAGWAFIYRLGVSYDVLGMYFLFRCLIRDWHDLRSAIWCIAAISIPVATAFCLEYTTGRNMFSVFGGVPEITVMRQNKLRCQGAFSHPILAGCFWASLVPLFAALCWSGVRDIVLGVVAVFMAGMIVLFCASSTPAGGLIAAFVCFSLLPLRRHMRYVRWGVLVTLAALHMVMRGPVWSLIARIDISGGSTGYHRYALIDAFIRRFPEWCVVGTRGTAHWGWGLEDVTNEYVAQGVNGGIFALVLFLVMLGLAFASVGRMLRVSGASKNRSMTVMSWGLGSSLFVHCVNFVGVSYFGQAILAWYLVLAVIASLDPGSVALPLLRRPTADRGRSRLVSSRSSPGSSHFSKKHWVVRF